MTLRPDVLEKIRAHAEARGLPATEEARMATAFLGTAVAALALLGAPPEAVALYCANVAHEARLYRASVTQCAAPPSPVRVRFADGRHAFDVLDGERRGLLLGE